MKKITLLGVSMVFFVSVFFAQSSTVQLGLKAGVNFSALDNAGQLSDHRTGYYAGALAHIHLSRHFALQPEASYSVQGGEYGTVTENKLHYINVPVLAQYMIANGLRLQTGPQLGFLTSAKNESVNEEVTIKPSMKDTDVSWSFGASYVSPVGLGVDARYNTGLTNISKNNSELKNRVWQVGLFYQFR